MTLVLRHCALIAAAACSLLVACGSKIPTQRWALEAQSASERAVHAYLTGDMRVADVEWKKALHEVAATGQPAAMARMALLQCAAQTAALELTGCLGYQRYAAGAAMVEQAYARYLQGLHTAADVPMLPAAQQPVALQLLQQGQWLAALPHAEPLSQLTAAGVALRAGLISQAGVQQAVDVASEQGWRRAAMAWVLVAQRMAQEAGDADTVRALALRLEILQETKSGKDLKK